MERFGRQAKSISDELKVWLAVDQRANSSVSNVNINKWAGSQLPQKVTFQSGRGS